MSSSSRGFEDYCRLFILGGKGNTDDEFRDMFGKYGTVKDVWILKDRHSNQEKGIVYVQMGKPSEAALAIEEMNGKFMPNNPKPIRVLLASSRKEGNVRDPKEDEKMLRLFIIIPKDYETSDVEKLFRDYGDIDYVRIIRDRSTNKSKGLAYVKYYRAYCAALALESCSPEFKAIFAESKGKSEGPAPSRRQDRWSESESSYDYNDRSSMGGSTGFSSGASLSDRRDSRHQDVEPIDIIRNYPSVGETRLEALIGGVVSEDTVFRLFDVVPGLDVCNFDRPLGIAYVKYVSPQCAAWAKEKLNGFEFPAGYRLQVRYAPMSNSSHSGRTSGTNRSSGYDQPYDFTSDSIGDSVSGLKRSIDAVGMEGTNDTLQSLVDSIQKATSVLERAGLSSSLSSRSGMNSNPPSMGSPRVRYCNLDLPSTKPLLSKDTPCEERLFLVSQPAAFAEHILTDLLCRFGGLIDAYFMPGKNYGYAKFASKDSAMAAIKILHGQRVCDMRLKVMEAEPLKYSGDGESSHKRQRP